jgi:hypothetical protein
MYETVWFHFHAITEALLSSLNSDIYVTFAAVDILCYSLNSSIFLNLRTERAAFAGQLFRFQKMCLEADSSLICKLNDDSWFQRVSEASPETAMECIADIHHLSVLLKDGIQESANYEVTRSVAARIEKKARVLELNTFFVREGDLFKKSRTGRLVAYKFFLFSDHLIYSHQSIMGIGTLLPYQLHPLLSISSLSPPSSSLAALIILYHLMSGTEFKVHEQLALAPMTISDIDDPSGCSFFIAHPTKSFVIVAESREVKSLWLRDTFQTIVSCRKREALKLNGQRKMSIIDRIEGQQKSGLVHPTVEHNTPFPKRVHPHPLPNLDVSKSPPLRSFSPASTRVLLDAQKSNRALFPVALPSSGTSVTSSFSNVTSSPPKGPIEVLEEDLGADPPPDGVFSAIMQMATLHMDEVELLTGEGALSPEGSSGASSPGRSQKDSSQDLSGLAIALDKLTPERPGCASGTMTGAGTGSVTGAERLSDAELAAEAEQKVALKREAVLTFEKRVKELPEKSLRGLYSAVSVTSLFALCIPAFNPLLYQLFHSTPHHPSLHSIVQGTTFWRGMTESRGGGGVPEDTKLRLHALFTQAKNGPTDRDSGSHPHNNTKSEESKGIGAPSSSSGIGPADPGSVDVRVEGLKRSYSSPPALIPSPSDTSNEASIDCPTGTGILARSMSTDQGHLEAGKDWSSLCQEDAMRSFLSLLFSLAPYWKYEQFI